MDPLDESLTYFNPYEEIEKHGFQLPHWQQPGATCFVTFRLADSIPRDKLDAWREERDTWLDAHPKPWTAELEREYHERFSGRIERWLDRGHGSCVLGTAEVADLLAGVLMFHDRERYHFHIWVIMPNHVHGLFSLRPGEKLDACLKNWKGIASRRINQHLGRTGKKLWQRNYFDRLIRNGPHFRNVVRYIRRNPKKANLREGQFRLYESKLVKKLISD